MGRGGGQADRAARRGWETEQEGPGGSAEAEGVGGRAASALQAERWRVG